MNRLYDSLTNPKISTALSAKIVRHPAIKKIRTMLSVWIKDNQKIVLLSGPLIRYKGKCLYKEPGDVRTDETEKPKQRTTAGFFGVPIRKRGL